MTQPRLSRSKKAIDAALDRRDVLGMLIAGAAVFQARSLLAQTAVATPTVTATVTPTPQCDPATIPALLKDPLLFTLVADLVRDDRLRRQFGSDPGTVFERYGLATNATLMATLYTMNVKTVAAYLRTETKNWLDAFDTKYCVADRVDYLDPVTEPQPTPNCDQQVLTDYPDVTPRIFKVRWQRKKPTAIVTVFGQSFPREPDPKNPILDIRLVLDDGSGPEPASTTTVLGTFRASQIVGEFQDIADGLYALKITAKTPFPGITNWNTCKVDLTKNTP